MPGGGLQGVAAKPGHKLTLHRLGASVFVETTDWRGAASAAVIEKAAAIRSNEAFISFFLPSFRIANAIETQDSTPSTVQLMTLPNLFWSEVSGADREVEPSASRGC